MKTSFWQKIKNKFYIDKKLFIGKKDPNKTAAAKDEKKHLRHPQAVKITCVVLLLLLVVGSFALDGSYFSWNLAEMAAQLQNADTNKPNEDNVAAFGELDITVQPVYDAAPFIPPEEDAAIITTNATPEPPAEQAAAKVSTDYDATWQISGEMTILRGHGYSFDPTWQDYRFHNGIDLALKEGSAATALVPGTITELGENRALGQFVRLEQNGLQILYAGLIIDDSWAVGDNVQTGDVLGHITASPLYEANELPHLHFELATTEGPIDPQTCME